MPPQEPGALPAVLPFKPAKAQTFFFTTPRIPLKPVLPFVPVGEHDTIAAAPELTLEAHAALCAHLAASPAHADQIFARYGLGEPEHRARVDQAWKAKLRADSTLYAEWQRVYRKFYAELMRQGGGE